MLKKIKVEHLRVGMCIHEFCGPWTGHPFWCERFTVRTAEEIGEIRRSAITEVWIDVAKGADVELGDSKVEVAAAVDRVLKQAARPVAMACEAVAIGDELWRAERICHRARGAMMSMFQQARLGKAIDVGVAGALVEEIAASVRRNPAALISLVRLKSVDQYTYMHSVAVCALMTALARQLGLDEAATREAGLAGLLHDVGKALTPDRILNKPGRLTEEEFAVIRRHPLDGHRLLLEGGSVSDIVLDVCLHHHEKADGSGYPHGLGDDQLSLFVKLVAVCDVYDAITSDRAYKAGWDPADAIRKMAEWSHDHFEERVFLAFVKTIGIYPVGSLVRLSSGRVGVVVEQGTGSLLTPRVKTFFSTRSQAHIRPEVIDLASPRCSERIVGCEPAAHWGADHVRKLWASG